MQIMHLRHSWQAAKVAFDGRSIDIRRDGI
jgi:hypothetical protein